jgi:hypothetical protein
MFRFAQQSIRPTLGRGFMVFKGTGEALAGRTHSSAVAEPFGMS